MAKLVLVFAALVAVALAANNTDWACDCRSGMCKNIPSDHRYILTSFCDQSTACGTSCGNCMWAYSTSAFRFGCNAQLKCCNDNGRCTTLQVIDSGPACWVEEKANMPIIDASYSTCQYFTGRTSCGWSDGIHIRCDRVSDSDRIEKSELGPCASTKEQAANEGIPMCPPVEAF